MVTRSRIQQHNGRLIRHAIEKAAIDRPCDQLHRSARDGYRTRRSHRNHRAHARLFRMGDKEGYMCDRIRQNQYRTLGGGGWDRRSDESRLADAASTARPEPACRRTESEHRLRKHAVRGSARAERMATSADPERRSGSACTPHPSGISSFGAGGANASSDCRRVFARLAVRMMARFLRRCPLQSSSPRKTRPVFGNRQPTCFSGCNWVRSRMWTWPTWPIRCERVSRLWIATWLLVSPACWSCERRIEFFLNGCSRNRGHLPRGGEAPPRWLATLDGDEDLPRLTDAWIAEGQDREADGVLGKRPLPSIGRRFIRASTQTHPAAHLSVCERAVLASGSILVIDCPDKNRRSC